MRKITLITTIILIVASLFMFVACDKQAPTTTSDLNTSAVMDNINEANDAQGVFLSMNSEAISASDENPMIRNIVATVLPEDAYDKSVDWSVSWSNNNSGLGAVEEYLIVTPKSDGSCEAVVECLKGFDTATIAITATTRYGGHTASVEASYSGQMVNFNFDRSLPLYANSVVEYYNAINPLREGNTPREVFNVYDSYGAYDSGITFKDYFGDEPRVLGDVGFRLVGSFACQFWSAPLDECTDKSARRVYGFTTVDGNTNIKSLAESLCADYDVNIVNSADIDINTYIQNIYRIGFSKSNGNNVFNLDCLSNMIFMLGYTDGVNPSENGTVYGLSFYSILDGYGDVFLPFYEFSFNCGNSIRKINIRCMPYPETLSLDTNSIVF